MSPLPEILFEVARNPILAGESSSSSPSGPSRPARLLATADNDPVGLPIGLGAASGFITVLHDLQTKREPDMYSTDHVAATGEPAQGGLWTGETDCLLSSNPADDVRSGPFCTD
jgi:hypothetical protein